jgi:hypothetical protein
MLLKIWKRIRPPKEPKYTTWQPVDQKRIPLNAGRIWLVDKDGTVRRALGWTWPILNRREPHKFRWWMSRENHAREPGTDALAALKALVGEPRGKAS